MESTQARQAQKFGTFLGVFTPSALTILGLIMYLRFGWVLGNLGLPLTLLVVLAASSITFITALSASAIATNIRVGVGGEYYMVSHSLGLEFGGAIGIPLYLCRTLSITFYSFGLAESIVLFWPDSWGLMPDYSIQLLTAALIIIIIAVSGKSASLALKLQIPVMLAVGVSLLALTTGVFSSDLQSPELEATYRTAPEGFWYIFAVFFPAVTGFTAGIGMSGDLRNPRKSIPKGTMLAVLTGAIIYLTIPVVLSLSGKISPEELAQPGVGIWITLALFGAILVYPGIWGAILSSAFGSALGGPRVLQALAQDGLAPKFLRKLSKTGQPTISTWVSGAIALAAVGIGNLNAVAQFVTILFLTLYVTINMSATIEKLAGDPSYRPKINVPWYVSLIGSIGAIVVMFLLNPLACIIAIILEISIYLYIRKLSLQKRWGDVRAGFWMSLSRFALLKLRLHKRDPRNWRPNILVFVYDTAKHLGLVRLACWFNQNRGVITACQLIIGDLKKDIIDLEKAREEMNPPMDNSGLIAFSEVNVVSDFENGAIDIIQSNGIAGLHSNTVLFGWSEKQDRLESQLRIINAVSKAGISSIIARTHWAHDPGKFKKIDVWWGGRERNGDMMLLLAYLLNMNPEWKEAKIILRSIINSEEEKESMALNLSELISEVRIEADYSIIVKPPDKSVTKIIHENSRNSDIVFLGLMLPEPGKEVEYAKRLKEFASGLNTTIFIRSAGEFAGHLI